MTMNQLVITIYIIDKGEFLVLQKNRAKGYSGLEFRLLTPDKQRILSLDSCAVMRVGARINVNHFVTIATFVTCGLYYALLYTIRMNSCYK